MAASLPFPIELRGTSVNVVAAVGSLALNLGGMYLAGHLMSGARPEAGDLAREKEPEELVVSLEELIPQLVPAAPEAPKQPEQKAYLSTFANQESQQAPENARFESDRNTVAMTEKAPADPSADAVPTQAGEKKIPFMALQEHRFKDGPDGEIPRSPQVEPGVPVVAAMMPKLPGEEAPDSQKPDSLKEPNQSENRQNQPDAPDPLAKEFQELPPQPGDAKAQKRDLKPGEDGGAQETLEMANVDVAKMTTALAEKLNVMDETVPVQSDAKQAMPERNPEMENPVNPLLMAPQRAQEASAPLRAQPITGAPREAVAPLPPGAMASQPTHGTADASAFSPEHHRNEMKGSLSNVGRTSALDAEATPLGQYKKLVNRAIERRWHQLRMENESFLSYGSLRIRFEVRRDGKVQGVRVLHEDANAIMTNFSLQAIHTAKIPPMPEEIVNLTGQDGLQATYDIIIY